MSLSRSPSLSVSLVRAEEKRFALASCLSYQKKLRSWPDSALPWAPWGQGPSRAAVGRDIKEVLAGGPGSGTGTTLRSVSMDTGTLLAVA